MPKWGERDDCNEKKSVEVEMPGRRRKERPKRREWIYGKGYGKLRHQEGEGVKNPRRGGKILHGSVPQLKTFNRRRS